MTDKNRVTVYVILLEHHDDNTIEVHAERADGREYKRSVTSPEINFLRTFQPTLFRFLTGGE